MEPNSQNNIRYQEARKKVKSIRGFYIHLTVYLFVNIMLLVGSTWDEGLWVGLQDISNYFTAFFWGIGLLAHWAGVFGSDFFFGKKWEEKKIRELMEKEKGNRWE